MFSFTQKKGLASAFFHLKKAKAHCAHINNNQRIWWIELFQVRFNAYGLGDKNLVVNSLKEDQNTENRVG